MQKKCKKKLKKIRINNYKRYYVKTINEIENNSYKKFSEIDNDIKKLKNVTPIKTQDLNSRLNSSVEGFKDYLEQSKLHVSEKNENFR